MADTNSFCGDKAGTCASRDPVWAGKARRGQTIFSVSLHCNVRGNQSRAGALRAVCRSFARSAGLLRRAASSPFILKNQ